MTNEQLAVIDLVDTLSPVCPEMVTDKALEILETSGLDAALAEVRRAKAFDSKPGHGNL